MDSGAVVFGMGRSMPELIAGRMLIGLGVCAGLMGALKMIALWFDRAQWPLVNGLLMAAGGLGSLFATAPTQAALGVMTWHEVFFLLSGLTVLVALAIFSFAPEKPSAVPPGTLGEQIAAVREILRDGFFWRITPVFTASQAAFIGIQTLWIGPWLRDVAGQDATTRGTSMMLVTVAMTVGFMTSGMTAGALAKRGISNMAAATWSMVALLLSILCLMVMPLGWLPVTAASSVLAWGVFAFLGTYAIIYFPVLTGAYPLHLSGRVTTSVNFIMFVTVFLTQWGFGRVLDAWPRTASGGYAPAGYALAFSVVAGMLAVSLVWLLVSRARPREG
jgi:MFS family permease